MNKLIYILEEKEQKNKNKNIVHVLLYKFTTNNSLDHDNCFMP